MQANMREIIITGLAICLIAVAAVAGMNALDECKTCTHGEMVEADLD